MALDIAQIAANFNNDPGRLMDILIEIQNAEGYISDEAIAQVAQGLNCSKVDVLETVTFYHFFSRTQTGKYAVYLNNSAVAEMKGVSEIAAAFEKEAGCSFGEVTSDSLIGLHYTADIGMNDQEPAALINGIPFANLTTEKVSKLVAAIKAGTSIADLVGVAGKGDSAIASTVNDNLRMSGKVVFDEYEAGAAVKKALSLDPDALIKQVKDSNLRGRGGAGFPAGMKWEFCRKAPGEKHYVMCNADEGEPGTFKDRVIITRQPELMFDGMICAGYAIGAQEGIIYLRGEYRYMREFLESRLQSYRDTNLLGENIAGKSGFNFDLRIQFGAGAYVCGEESALIESAEGKRGEPRSRPPFPVTKGYNDMPTSVNNVETFCAAARIVLNGAEWYKGMGTQTSSGTKVLSVSGDCDKPGVYEIEWGMRINDLLSTVGATNSKAVQVGGPSGTMISENEFGRALSYEDLATGGSIIIIGKDRNILSVISNFIEFFKDESCGACVPCRTGNQLLKEKVEKIIAGNGVADDVEEINQIATTMKNMSRCGLGQTASNPIITALQNFKTDFDEILSRDSDYQTGFNLEKAVSDACEYAGRTPQL
ncbi:MAG: hypothetical protein GF398_06400 [Chitinivibrionales bacterium]|nr:hypothetical protein [Chitinivibrionales bacterium]